MLPDLSHYPVMVNEVVSFLKPKDNSIYLDGTFGQGGYSRKILESCKCQVLAIDRDNESSYYAEKIKKRYRQRFVFKNEIRLLHKLICSSFRKTKNTII